MDHVQTAQPYLEAVEESENQGPQEMLAHEQNQGGGHYHA
ncbi:MAG: hypothetical protein PWQ29_493 [Verrucomicrobiota bacterium]|jgi:hypothetical protein|nr:hypothetical protein [Verrucomicrobiota bacterium]MDK2963099.1 hypothetical protein [Verrucomicrobiota bacterium]